MLLILCIILVSQYSKSQIIDSSNLITIWTGENNPHTAAITDEDSLYVFYTYDMVKFKKVAFPLPVLVRISDQSKLTIKPGDRFSIIHMLMYINDLRLGLKAESQIHINTIVD